MQRNILLLLCLLATYAHGQQAYFVDGYHGGIYGHYPVEWKTRFIVEKFHQHPNWSICLEIEPETWDTVRVQTPQHYAHFKAIVTNKRVEFTNPTYAQPYAYNISGESLIRQFEYGIKKTREHFPEVEFTTYAAEEPCFTSCLPQLLKQFGFKYAVLKTPNTCWGGYMRAYGGELVNWIGPDGTPILTVPRYASEAFETNSTWQTKAWINSKDYLDACRAQGIAHPVGMCFQDAGWKNGPWLGAHPEWPYVTWRRYFEDISVGTTTDNWHLTQEDVLVNLMWGSEVLQRIARQVRAAENTIVRAEKVAAMAHVLNHHTYPQPRVDDAWRTLMLAQHHDSWIVPYNHLHKGRTWADEIELWTTHTDTTAAAVVTDALKSFDRETHPTTTAPGFVRVYNTLSTPRREVVDVLLDATPYADSNIALRNAAGKTVPCHATRQGANLRLTFEADVPAFGYATYRITKTKTPAATPASAVQITPDECVLENDMYRITLDTRRGGVMKSLIAKTEGGREFVDRAHTFGFGELRGYFYDEERFRSSTENPVTVTVLEDSDLRVSIRLTGEIAAQPFEQTISLARGSRLIDCALTINWTENRGIGEYKQGDNWRDNRRAFCDDRFKLNLLFPANLTKAKLYKNAPFDVCESRLDNTFFQTWDSIKHNIILHWVDLLGADNQHGLTLLTDHTTSYSYGDDFPLALTARYSGIGLWGPNYKTTRPLHMRFALIPHADAWHKAGIAAEAGAWNEPLVTTLHTRVKPENKSLITLPADSGYELSAVKPCGDALLVRLFNASGSDAPQTLHFGFDVKSVHEVDLNHQIIGEPRVRRKGVTVAMPRFGLKTLLVR